MTTVKYFYLEEYKTEHLFKLIEMVARDMGLKLESFIILKDDIDKKIDFISFPLICLYDNENFISTICGRTYSEIQGQISNMIKILPRQNL